MHIIGFFKVIVFCMYLFTALKRSISFSTFNRIIIKPKKKIQWRVIRKFTVRAGFVSLCGLGIYWISYPPKKNPFQMAMAANILLLSTMSPSDNATSLALFHLSRECKLEIISFPIQKITNYK